jgi:hypothetical protein
VNVNYSWFVYVYTAYAPIDLNFALGVSMWQNFTTGYPTGDIQSFSNISGYEVWNAGNGQGGWTWNDSPDLH